MLFGLFGRKKEKEEGKGVFLGKVVHYFPKVKAAVIKIEKGKLSTGDKIRVAGRTTDFEQTIESMQIEHAQVDSAHEKDEVAVQVKKKTRRKDKVFLLIN